MTQTIRSYTALIYPVLHTSAHTVTFRAECVQYPGIVAERETPNTAAEGLRKDLMAAVSAGEPETAGDVVITTISISKPDGKGSVSSHAYTAVVTPDTESQFAAFCPALGVATDGVTSDEALSMLEDAANLFLLDQPLPAHDVQVIIERLALPIPDSLAEALISAFPLN